MSKPNVLILHNIISPHVEPLFQSLAQKVKLEVLFCAQSESNRNWQVKPTGFKYEILPNRKIEFKGDDLFTLFINPTIFKTLDQKKPDLIVISGWDLPTYWLTALYCQIKRIPFLLWSGSTTFENSWRRSITRLPVKVLVSKAAGYLAYGLKARDYLINLGADPKKITIAYNGVALKNYSRLTDRQEQLATTVRKQLNLVSKTVILYYGQLIARKKADLLIKAFSELDKKQNVQLLIVGNGNLKTELLALIKGYHLTNVELIPDPGDKNMPAYFSLADIFVLPSTEDVWGLVVNQAMAAGLPVIVSDKVGSAADLVLHGVTGLIFTADNVNHLTTQLETLITSKSLRNQMGNKAKQRVQITSPMKVAEQIYLAISGVTTPSRAAKIKTKEINRLISLPVIKDDCLLAVAQSPSIPFSIARVYFICQPKTNLARGFHAHYQNQQILFCLHGSVRIVLDDGKNRRDEVLIRPDQGIVIDKMIWHEMHDMTKDTVLVVLASRPYEPEDYIRNYYQFIKEVKTYGKNII